MKKYIYVCVSLCMLFLGITLYLLPIKTSPRLNVAFAINNKHSFYSMLVVNSIMRNNTSKSKYTFWVLESDLTPHNKKWMTDYVEKEWKQELKFVTISDDYIKKWKKMRRFVPPIAMARILIPKIMPSDADKALYLDTDMLVTTDLKELFDIDLGDKHVGIVKNVKGLVRDANNGMILFNLPKWRETNMVEQMLDYLEKHPKIFLNQGEKKAKTSQFDQGLVNRVLKNKMKIIDKKWNNQKDNGPITACIYHFLGRKRHAKPWFHHKNGTPAQNLYMQYYRESSLYGRPEDCIMPKKKK